MLPGLELVNPELTLLTPHLIVLGLALLLLVMDIALPRSRHYLLTYLTVIGYAAALVASFFFID